MLCRSALRFEFAKECRSHAPADDSVTAQVKVAGGHFARHQQGRFSALTRKRFL
jgi:hypothetical protein